MRVTNTPARLCAVLVVAVVTVTLTQGCSLLPFSPDPVIPGAAIGKSIDAQLKVHEAQGIADVDLASAIAGDWTQVVVVCTGSTNIQLDRALGFHWSGAPNVSSSSFLAMLVFSTGSQVESYYSVGQNDFEEDLYWTPCSSPLENGGSEPSPFALAKTDSSIRFVRNAALPYWYVSVAELKALSARSLHK
jgi:hypothetical protein